MEELKNFVTVAEYADLYNMEPQSVKKRCQRGTLTTARKIGRDWLIDKREIPNDKRVKSGTYRDWREKGRQSQFYKAAQKAASSK